MNKLLTITLMLSYFCYMTPALLMTETNNIVLRGAITEKSADDFIYSLLLNNPEYVYITSNGGSVSAGHRMVAQIQQRNLTCIADRAYSMAFVILQACTHRYITTSSSVMQHQMSLGIRGPLMNMNNYLNMVNQVEEELNQMQADRIGLSLDAFEKMVSTDWWLAGQDIIDKNVADIMVSVSCTPELVQKNVTVTRQSFFGDDIIETYSACPLINKPIHVKGDDGFFFESKEHEETTPEVYLITL